MRKVLYRSSRFEHGVTVFSTMSNKGFFHCFDNEFEYAVIEDKEGYLSKIRIDMFKFVDSPETIDREQRRYEIAREQMAHGVIPRMAVNDADCLIEVLKGKSK